MLGPLALLLIVLGVVLLVLGYVVVGVILLAVGVLFAVTDYGPRYRGRL